MVVLNIDVRFADLEYELWALAEFRASMKGQVRHLIDQRMLRTTRELREKCITPQDPEYEWAMEEIEVLENLIVPRFLRAPVVVALWSFVETGISQVARYIAEAKSQRLQFQDVAGRSLRQRCSKYFEMVLGYPLGVSDEAWSRLDDLRRVRNVIAHANGQMTLMKQEEREFIQKLVDNDPRLDERNGYLLVSDEYLDGVQALVSSEFTALLSRVKRDFGQDR